MTKPFFSFGLITDVQYADVDDGTNFAKTKRRFYRKALGCLNSAIKYWNDNEKTLFMLQLGDLIDGWSNRTDNRNEDFRKVTDTLAKFGNPVVSCWGNHDLYNFKREELMNTLLYPNNMLVSNYSSSMHNLIPGSSSIDMFTGHNFKEEFLCCYHFSPFSGFRFIILDCYDISSLGRHPEHPKSKEAEKILEEKNPNKQKNDPTGAIEPRFVRYNCGVGLEQKNWLNEVLTMSDSLGERVIVSGHIAIHPESSCGKKCLLWNYEEILDLVESHRSTVAYFAGHDHDGAAYSCDVTGVHHCTFESVLEAIPESEGGHETAFATIDVYADRMEVRGVGDIISRVLKYRS